MSDKKLRNFMAKKFANYNNFKSPVSLHFDIVYCTLFKNTFTWRGGEARLAVRKYFKNNAYVPSTYTILKK